ncbi:hypothetical protein EVAR_65712_1 [Eumeta japonica]|uniref:Endonuclease/exonuclease/phosphatase domain-containing protein n=1 Tax=Eumeta variegata TaxID=151549 RepID=A0A4C2A995_EUMVA|nr:hypothetical protein EVAR_65712_1 [Eumeta japonica]
MRGATGGEGEKTGGQAYRDFLDEMGFHILNTGSTPTFETYRGDRIYSSIVDVTACSSPLIGRVEWRVDRTATTSDHNAIVFNLRLSGPIKPMEPITTRRYNTNKADWTEFCLQLRNTLQKYGIAERTEENKSESPLVDSGTKRSKKRRLAQKEENPQRSPREKGRNQRLPYGQDDIHSESRNSTDRKLERVLHDPGQRKACGTKYTE